MILPWVNVSQTRRPLTKQPFRRGELIRPRRSLKARSRRGGGGGAFHVQTNTSSCLFPRDCATAAHTPTHPSIRSRAEERRGGGGRAPMANTGKKLCTERPRGKEVGAAGALTMPGIARGRQAGRQAEGHFLLLRVARGQVAKSFLYGESRLGRGAKSLKGHQPFLGDSQPFNILGSLPKTEAECAPFRASLSSLLRKDELRGGRRGAGCLLRGRGAKSCRCWYQKEDCPNILSLSLLLPLFFSD